MNIIVKPTSVEESFFIEEILKKMGVPYEKEQTASAEFSQPQTESIKRGIEQADRGLLKSNLEVRKKAESYIKYN
ncbi:hypothetical protein [Capnocytophaga sp.]|uniref:hypothetical protein n=1 Tax=Capnocytophaga sp. TaxID=44737 RepID=UPI0026DBBAEC|nr:hypothetical protein [Capnocytophaga sp.]MDO5105801.1 hypothetical protein [Capnocytophaga sp.]